MTLRLGLIAASRIADEAVVEPARKVDGVEIVAVAARDDDRARAAADRWGLGTWYGSYEALLADRDVDAVYVATPAAMHREWTLAALDAGKHVLVEKPMAANAADARIMLDASHESDLVVMEAFHWRYHPLVEQMVKILDSGEIGEVHRVEAGFVVSGDRIPRHDIRWDLTLGGGAMMDLGIYPAGWVWWAMGERPKVTTATAVCPVPDVDGRLDAELEWASGVSGSIVCSMIEPEGFRAWLTMRGSKGTMQVDNPLAPQRGSEISVTTASGTVVEEVPTTATYFHQMEAFRDAIVDGRPFPTTVEAGWQMMGFIDSCYEAAGLSPRPSSNRWSD